MAQTSRRGLTHVATTASALLTAVAAAGIAVLIRARLTPARVEGPSMMPTLPPGALIAIAPRGRVRLGSVVVVLRPGEGEHVKRVVAAPGEEFRGTDGRIFVLGPDEFAVAGDNRAASIDSRRYGPVRRAEIEGVVRLCYWPPSAWGSPFRPARGRLK